MKLQRTSNAMLQNPITPEVCMNADSNNRVIILVIDFWSHIVTKTSDILVVRVMHRCRMEKKLFVLISDS